MIARLVPQDFELVSGNDKNLNFTMLDQQWQRPRRKTDVRPCQFVTLDRFALRRFDVQANMAQNAVKFRVIHGGCRCSASIPRSAPRHRRYSLAP